MTRDAARDALAPTRDALQASAADLFDRMTTAALHLRSVA